MATARYTATLLLTGALIACAGRAITTFPSVAQRPSDFNAMGAPEMASLASGIFSAAKERAGSGEIGLLPPTAFRTPSGPTVAQVSALGASFGLRPSPDTTTQCDAGRFSLGQVGGAATGPVSIAPNCRYTQVAAVVGVTSLAVRNDSACAALAITTNGPSGLLALDEWLLFVRGEHAWTRAAATDDRPCNIDGVRLRQQNANSGVTTVIGRRGGLQP